MKKGTSRRDFLRLSLGFAAVVAVPTSTPLAAKPEEKRSSKAGSISYPVVPPTIFLQATSGIVLAGVFMMPTDEDPTTLELAHGGEGMVYGCGMRSFIPPCSIMMTSLVSSFHDHEQCAGPIDLNYFNDDDQVYGCPFDYGCVSKEKPLLLTYEATRHARGFDPLNMVFAAHPVQPSATLTP